MMCNRMWPAAARRGLAGLGTAALGTAALVSGLVATCGEVWAAPAGDVSPPANSLAEDPATEATVDAGAVARLLDQLNAPRAALREAAEKELIAAAPVESEAAGRAFLERLPAPTNNMPPEMRLRLQRIRGAVQSRIARAVFATGRVTADWKEASLERVLADIESQTGSRLVDHRQEFGQEEAGRSITLKVEGLSFWETLDRLLDEADLDLYAYSGGDGLAVVPRGAQAVRRCDKAAYCGMFRVEAVSLVARRDLRAPEQSQLRLALEIAWEPRFSPIAISQPIDQINAMTDEGLQVPVVSSRGSLDIEVQADTFATELVVPLRLPSRRDRALATLEGSFQALIPGRVAQLKFDRLEQADHVTQELEGVRVTLERVRRSQSLWQVHMRIAVSGEETGLESHRDWVYRNLATLRTPEGEIVDNVGYETTRQTPTEVGFIYLYDLPAETQDLAGYEWVYQTPVAIQSLPVEYRLREIPLP